MNHQDDVIPSNLTQPSPTIKKQGEYTIADFQIIKEIGEGSYSTVYHAREKEGKQRDVAIKMVLKMQIVKERKVEAIHREKNILARFSSPEHKHPFVITLLCTMQDREHLYFVMTYAEKGDLLHIMNKLPDKKMNEEQSTFYAAELCLVLDHIHSLNIVHRDVKPENILIRNNGHILISDFGSARILEPHSTEESKSASDEDTYIRTRRASFVGTAQYVSPEVLSGASVTVMCDWWAFGVCLYQFITGRFCFDDESEYLIYKRIQNLLYSYPEDFPESARNLIDKLLIIEPTDRLGSDKFNGRSSLREHNFFHGIDWDHLTEQEPPSLG